MALQFPLITSVFLDKLPISSITLDAPAQVEVSTTGSGEILEADLGPRLWLGEITLGRMTPNEAAQAKTLIDMARGPARGFHVYDTTRNGPQADPFGAILGASTVLVNAVSVDNMGMQLKGLPAGYQLTIGDYLSFDYGSNPTRTALHKVVDLTVAADGTGVTPTFEITPNLRPGASIDATVRLIKPYCKAIIIPGSVQPGRRKRFMTEGVSFQFMQTLR